MGLSLGSVIAFSIVSPLDALPSSANPQRVFNWICGQHFQESGAVICFHVTACVCSERDLSGDYLPSQGMFVFKPGFLCSCTSFPRSFLASDSYFKQRVTPSVPLSVPKQPSEHTSSRVQLQLSINVSGFDGFHFWTSVKIRGDQKFSG